MNNATFTVALDFSRIDSQPETSGVFRYCRDLMVELKRANPQDFSFVVLGSRPAPHEKIAALFGAGSRWKYRTVALRDGRGAWLLNNLILPSGLGRIDLFHGLSAYVPLFCNARTVATVFDLMHEMFPEYTSIANSREYRWQKFLLKRRTDALVTISESTRNDLMERWQIPSQCVRAIPLGTDFRLPAAEGSVANAATLVLAPYNLEPRKNLAMLVEAVSQLRAELGDVRLELFGRAAVNDERENKFRQFVETCGMTPYVRQLGIVSDATLAAKMAAADVFVFPSLYEGFGLPVLEAMAVGACVVAAKRGAMVEVVGSAGYLVDEMTAAGWTKTIRTALKNEASGKSVRANAAQAARVRTPTVMANQTLELYRDLFGR